MLCYILVMKYPRETLEHFLTTIEQNTNSPYKVMNREFAHELYLYAKKKYPKAKIIYYKYDQLICITDEALSAAKIERGCKSKNG